MTAAGSRSRRPGARRSAPVAQVTAAETRQTIGFVESMELALSSSWRMELPLGKAQVRGFARTTGLTYSVPSLM